MVIEVHTSSSFCPFSSSSAVRCLLRTLNEPDSVLWVKELAAIGSMPGEAPPQMIEIEAVGAIAILLEKRSMLPNSSAYGQGPRSSAGVFEAASASLRVCAKLFLFHTLALTPSSGRSEECRVGKECVNTWSARWCPAC